MLPIDKVNRVSNLATMYWSCLEKIYDGQDHTDLSKTVWDKINGIEE